jgi:xylulokinase
VSRYLLGYDVGSSSIKATLLDVERGTAVASAVSPERELAIKAPRPGWAEQDPESWWEHVGKATARLGQEADLREVAAVGISYQMHGLVCLDGTGKVLRPAIIWCDSRAVEIGDKAFAALGESRCLERLLNSPGNFTASKLRWVKENEPQLFERIDKVLLPGDYIAYRLTGEIRTTPSGLSEGILWDFREGALARFLLEHYGIPEAMIAPVVPSFSVQGTVTRKAAEVLGLAAGTPVTYRAGDQPNNALSLNVLHPGEVAATAGTSGVVYGVGSRAAHDLQSRVNTFVHVNHRPGEERYGTLMCVNGTAILNSWLKHNTMSVGPASLSYEQMNALAAQAPVGSEGLRILPYGNGAERTLGNRNPGAAVLGLDFNRHGRAHLLRAAQEGIVFALQYGLEIMKGMGLAVDRVRAGAANMFLSPLFGEAFAAVSGASVELYSTDGSQGAARGAGIGAGLYTERSAFEGLKIVKALEPNRELSGAYEEAYAGWCGALRALGRSLA